jgi:hypothetical protein
VESKFQHFKIGRDARHFTSCVPTKTYQHDILPTQGGSKPILRIELRVTLAGVGSSLVASILEEINELLLNDLVMALLLLMFSLLDFLAFFWF